MANRIASAPVTKAKNKAVNTSLSESIMCNFFINKGIDKKIINLVYSAR